MLSNRVIELEKKSPVLERIKNYRIKSEAIKNAIMRVAQHQMMDIGIRSQISSILTDHKWAKHGGVEEFCQRQAENIEKFPAEELRGLLDFLENRVRHVDNVIIALLAAIVGGLVGGALAVLAS